jgi:xanthine dehydrogenase YagR molybdenum-binding subunit
MWDGNKLTIYEESQGIVNMRGVLAQMFRCRKNAARIHPNSSARVSANLAVDSLSVGGSGATAGKPVSSCLAQMTTKCGSSPRTAGAARGYSSKPVSLQHDYVYHRSMLDDYHENCGEATSFHYSVPNTRSLRTRRRHIGSPSDMRGPGAVPGLCATESARRIGRPLKMDPVRLRVLNEPKIDRG